MDKKISFNESVIPITNEKFENYARLRIEYEKTLVNQTVVGLNNDKKVFMLGTISDRVGYGHTYIVQWHDETESQQEEEHLFRSITKPMQHRLNGFVLATDNEQYIYKPGRIITISDDRQTLTVRFIDSEDDHR